MSREFGYGPKICRLCGTTENLEYCSMCKYYFCTVCKHKYPERVKAMMEEHVVDPISDWLQSVFKI